MILWIVNKTKTLLDLFICSWMEPDVTNLLFFKLYFLTCSWIETLWIFIFFKYVLHHTNIHLVWFHPQFGSNLSQRHQTPSSCSLPTPVSLSLEKNRHVSRAALIANGAGEILGRSEMKRRALDAASRCCCCRGPWLRHGLGGTQTPPPRPHRCTSRDKTHHRERDYGYF